MPVRVELFLFRSSGFLRFGSVPLYEFRQCIVVDTESERLEIHCTYVHGRNIAYIPVALVLFHEKNGFRLVVQLRTDMPSCVFIAFVLVEYRMDVYLPVIRPLHQLGYDACRFSRTVDVIYHITDAVYDYKPYVRRIVNSLLYNPDTLFGRVFPQSKKFQMLIVPVIWKPSHP